MVVEREREGFVAQEVEVDGPEEGTWSLDKGRWRRRLSVGELVGRSRNLRSRVPARRSSETPILERTMKASTVGSVEVVVGGDEDGDCGSAEV